MSCNLRVSSELNPGKPSKKVKYLLDTGRGKTSTFSLQLMCNTNLSIQINTIELCIC